jgi:hypothetical protein
MEGHTKGHHFAMGLFSAVPPSPTKAMEDDEEAEEEAGELCALHMRAFDKNHDGIIDSEEIAAMLRADSEYEAGTHAGEGDPTMYEAEQLVARYRNRNAPDVLAELHRWWKKACGDLDTDVDGCLGRDEYREMHRRLVRAFAEDGNAETSEHLDAEAQAEAEEQDWLGDSHGDGAVDEVEFFDALFQLADLWTATTKEAEYVAFLASLFEKVFPPTEKLGAQPLIEPRLVASPAPSRSRSNDGGGSGGGCRSSSGNDGGSSRRSSRSSRSSSSSSSSSSGWDRDAYRYTGDTSSATYRVPSRYVDRQRVRKLPAAQCLPLSPVKAPSTPRPDWCGRADTSTPPLVQLPLRPRGIWQGVWEGSSPPYNEDGRLLLFRPRSPASNERRRRLRERPLTEQRERQPPRRLQLTETEVSGYRRAQLPWEGGASCWTQLKHSNGKQELSPHAFRPPASRDGARPAQPLRAGPFVWREHSTVPSHAEAAQRQQARRKPKLTLTQTPTLRAGTLPISNFAHVGKRLRRRDQRVAFGSATS